MKWTRTELIDARNNIDIDEDIDIAKESIGHYDGINDLQDVHVSGKGYYSDEDDSFYVDLNISGIMICPDSITNEPIEYPFER